MIVRKLNKEEQEYIKNLQGETFKETVELRKNHINKLIVDWIFEEKKVKNVWFEVTVQYGKSVINKLLFERFIDEGFYNILAIYPELRIVDDAVRDNPKAVNSILLDRAVKSEISTDVLLIDEIQYCLNPLIKRHQIFDIPHKFLYANAAFLEKKDIKLLESKGINYCFQLDEVTGIKLGIVPDCLNLNISIDLTRKEKLSYFSIQMNYKDCIDFIYPVYEKKSSQIIWSLLTSKSQREYCVGKLLELNLEITESQLLGKILKYLKIVKKRQKVLKNAEGKFDAAIKLVNKHSLQKGVIFVSDIEASNKLKEMIGSTAICYNSKSGENALESFRDGLYKQIIVVGKGNVGKISNDLEYSIHLSYEGQPIKGKQRKGRTMGMDYENPNKKPINYYLYIDNFKLFNQEVESQELVWIKLAQKSMLFVEYETLENVLCV